MYRERHERRGENVRRESAKHRQSGCLSLLSKGFQLFPKLGALFTPRYASLFPSMKSVSLVITFLRSVCVDIIVVSCTLI